MQHQENALLFLQAVQYVLSDCQTSAFCYQRKDIACFAEVKRMQRITRRGCVRLVYQDNPPHIWFWREDNMTIWRKIWSKNRKDKKEKEQHRHQIYDLGNDEYYIEPHRTDRPDIQDLKIRVFAAGHPIREERLLYNIKHDYSQSVVVKDGQIVYDELCNCESYGHLLWKDEMPPKEGSIYPFTYEPVTDKGCEMFQKEGETITIEIPKLQLKFHINTCNEETYEYQARENGLITNVKEEGHAYIYINQGQIRHSKSETGAFRVFQ